MFVHLILWRSLLSGALLLDLLISVGPQMWSVGDAIGLLIKGACVDLRTLRQLSWTQLS